MTNNHLAELVILYTEDDPSIRSQVAHFLSHRCARLILAENGREALELYRAQRPDMIVSDIMMPEMDGLEFAATVKADSPATPIILTTAFNDTDYLLRAIGIGIDEYVLKPINLEKLQAAISRQAEILFNARAFVASKAQLEAYHQAAEEERRLVADLMLRMMRPERLADPQIQYWLQPTDVVGGDLIAASRTQDGRLYVMLADSTGHGLPAALNLLPINHIFYSMVEKSLPVPLIVEEMNWAVKEQSPIDRYVAALIACIDNRNHVVEVWNGGIPAALLVGPNGDVAHSFNSVNLPLGILDRTFTAQTEIFQWSEHSQLVVYSDGIPEAENESGEAFGSNSIKEIIKKNLANERYEALRAALNNHLGSRHAFDDITLLMVDCPT
ncbi:MAG: SpoIIE family protein phosphatase [Gallionella sp.]|jgi:CheY-like chemotaxis protein|nr:SpoIIE family protein phosphatase [Gallionella sp.]MCK9354303.1 SpoIIE family protein phosphatase [Gallionella sp.]